MLKLCKCVVTAALALTLLPGLARAEMPRGSLVVILIEMAKPKKPEMAKPVPCIASPCCPMGVCKGAATLPCCPVASCPRQGPCSACPVHKPEGCCKPCCDKACCEQSDCCKAERTLAEMRAVCAEQARMLQEMQALMKEMRNTINMLQVEWQLQRQSQVICPPVTTPNVHPVQSYDTLPLPVNMGGPMDWNAPGK